MQVPELNTSVFILPVNEQFQTKNSQERVVVLNSIARRVIDEQRGKHAEFVFTYRGNPIKSILNSAWKRARVRAGLVSLWWFSTLVASTCVDEAEDQQTKSTSSGRRSCTRTHGVHRPVEAEVLERILAYGNLHHGFARLYCDQCGRDLLLAYSCKTRYFCSSWHQIKDARLWQVAGRSRPRASAASLVRVRAAETDPTIL